MALPMLPADPRPLYYVVGTVIGALVLWVGWVLATAKTREDLSPPPEAEAEKK